MKIVQLPSGVEMPAFGIGTWHMGERSSKTTAEVDALSYALDIGVTLFDTAEMYGNGGAEQVLGKAIQGRRPQCFIVSKVYPHNASHQGVIRACERSLKRLQTDYIDLYLLHWPGSEPLSDTFAGFEELQQTGKIREYGVSNFDTTELDEISETQQRRLGTNQIYYNLNCRAAEWSVIPWCRQRGVPVMAYCPLDPYGGLLDSGELQQFAQDHQTTAAQIALAWLLHQPQVVAIPKSSQKSRIQENFEALNLELSEQDLRRLDQLFPPPKSPVSLPMR